MSKKYVQNSDDKKSNKGSMKNSQNDHTIDELETIWNISPDLLCVADYTTSTFLKVNPSFKRLLGYDEDELLAKPFLDFIHPADIESTITVVEEQLKQGRTVVDFTNRYRCRDGSYKYLEWISRPIIEKGQTYAIARDVTRQKNAERERELLAQFPIQDPYPVMRIKLDGTVIFKNDASDMILKQWITTKDNKVSGRILSLVRNASTSQKLIQEEVGCEEKYFTLTFTPIPNSDLVNVYGLDITDRHNAEIKLQESEEKFHTIFESVTQGLIYVDNKGKVLEVNDSLCNIIGIKKSNLIGKTSLNLAKKLLKLHDLPRIMKIISRGLNGKTVEPFELFFNNKILEISAGYNKNNKRITGIIRDITEQKTAQDAMEKNEQLLTEVEKISKIGGWEMDLIDHTAKWTKGTYDIAEIEYNDRIPGLDDHVNYYLPKYQEMIKEKMNELIVKGIPLEFEAELKTVKGNIKWCKAYGRRIMENGKCTKVYGTFQDISVIKKVEQELTNTMTFNKTLLDNSPDVIYIYDIVERKNIYTNEGMLKILKYDSKDLQEMGDHILVDLMHPEDFQNYLKDIYPQYEDLADGEVFSHEYRMKHKDGSWRWLLSRESIFMRNDDGSPKQIFGLASDITESKKAKNELEESHARLIAILNGINEPIYLADPETYELIFVNKVMKDLFGEVEEKKCYEYIQNRHEPCPFCTNDIILGEYLGKSYIWEFQNEINNRWYRCIDKAIKWPDGRMVRYEMAIDIHERILVEEALKESEERFRELFNTMGSCVAVYEPYNDGEDFIFKDMNRASEIQSSLKKPDVINKKVTEVFPSVKEIGLFDVFQTVHRTGKKMHHPLIMYKDDRLEQWVENDVYKLPSGEIVAVYEDTSKLRKAEEDLNKYRQHLEELVKERTEELANSNAELKRMNKLFIGREFRIKELREKVKELEQMDMNNE